MKFGFDWPNGSREGKTSYYIYMYIAPGQAQTTTWGILFFYLHIYSVNLVLCCKFSH